jgi:hypothetical protein
MATGETAAHENLRRLAVAWALEQGFTAVATEVRLPKSRFRADVAAYKRGHDGKVGVTAAFECKQARSDFLKDSYSQTKTAARLQVLDARRLKLEELLKLHVPSLRRGDTLFAEFDAVNLNGFEHRTYRRVLREIGVLHRRLFGKTKFDRLVRYRCANVNYLVVEDGILAPHEVPAGWGLLVRRADALVLVRPPVWQDAGAHERLALLERIAAAGTRPLSVRCFPLRRRD